MITTSAFLDLVMADVVEVDPTDNTYVGHRARALRCTQQALEYFELALDEDADWAIKVGGTCTLSAGASSANAPTDFRNLTSHGSIWIQNDDELKLVDLSLILRMRRERAGGRGKPRFVAIGGQNASSPYQPLLQFDCIADAQYTIELDYLRVTPTLVDDTSGNTDKLSSIPSEHVATVLVPGVQELIGRLQGDGRTTAELGPAFKAAVAQVKAHRVQKRPDDSRLGDLGVRLHQMH